MFEKPIKYGAIAIDNCIFKSLKYRFEKGALSQMSQFKGSDIVFLQTDTIHNESIKHIAETLDVQYASMKTAMREIKLNSCLSSSDEVLINKYLDIGKSSIERATEILNDFYEKSGALILNSDKLVKIKDLMNIYFNNKPPFEKKADKKNEFPDAIALLTLESWAKKNNTRILVVSNDNGWVNFAENSQMLTVVRNLPSALNEIQRKDITEIVRSLIIDEDLLDLEEIKSEISFEVDTGDVNIDAYSHLSFDYDDLEVVFCDAYFIENNDSAIDFEIIRVDDNDVMIKIACDVLVEVNACFNFYVRDSIDNDNVSIGDCYRSIEESYRLDVFINLHGDFTEDDVKNISADDIEIVGSLKNANFGFIEPDYSPDDYDY